MEYKNLYEITGDIKRGCQCTYTIHIEAYTMKDAIEYAKVLWYGACNAHLFHINARKVLPDEVIDLKHWFSRTP